MVMLFLCQRYCRYLESPNLIKAMKQTCRTGVSWSFYLSMEEGQREYAEQKVKDHLNSILPASALIGSRTPKRLDADHRLCVVAGNMWNFISIREENMNQNHSKKVIIEAMDLSKTYRRFKKKEGIRGSITGLFKREYEEKAAVSHMDLQVREGEFIGLIGPNGAGKTTLIKMLTGIIAPTSGQLSVLGFVPNQRKDAFKKQYAVVMGQKSQLFFELTVNDILRLFQAIYESPEGEFQENKHYFVELFQVEELMDVQVRTLSLGERMKMELMVALLHSPRVLFLDEPTIGLDAIAARQIRNFLQEINRERHTTILLTSHYVEDIRMLCDRAVVVSHGRKFYDGSTAELFERYRLQEDEDMGSVMERIYQDGDAAWQRVSECGKEGHLSGSND